MSWSSLSPSQDSTLTFFKELLFTGENEGGQWPCFYYLANSHVSTIWPNPGELLRAKADYPWAKQD